MVDETFSVRIEVGTLETKKVLEHIVLTADGFRLQQDPNDLLDLLIFELGENLDEEFKTIEYLLASNSVIEVFVTAREQDTNLLLKAMRAGAKEFFTQPLNQLEIKTAMAAFKERFHRTARKEPKHNGKIIHVCGAKGGVGTTTIAVNLAMLLGKMPDAGAVALIDLNTVFGEIPLFLSIKPTYHWGHIAENLNRLDSTFLLNSMAKHKSGVHVLPSPTYLNGHPPATPEMMEHLLLAMKDTFDFIVIDGGQSLDGPALKTIEMSDEVLLVTLLSLPCLQNTKNLIKSLEGIKGFQKDRIRLVLNRYLKKTDITIKEAEENIHNQIFWNIPNDYKATMSAINRGMPLHVILPRANITKSLTALTEALIDGTSKPLGKKKWRLFGR